MFRVLLCFAALGSDDDGCALEMGLGERVSVGRDAYGTSRHVAVIDVRSLCPVLCRMWSIQAFGPSEFVTTICCRGQSVVDQGRDEGLSQ